MKFVSKSVCCLIMENVAFLILIFVKLFSKYILKNHNKFRQKSKHTSKKNETLWYLGHTDFEKFRAFLMILGTSKIWSKSGPGGLLTITKMLQKIQEKVWNHPGKILFLSIWDIIFSKIIGICMSYVPDFSVFCCFVFGGFHLLKYSFYL